ncbi:MAG: hypothetical protein IJR00_05390 [Lachnospiraceae bacterium]|nr:hypothetical protein [Lachnospiraceae bacterium]
MLQILDEKELRSADSIEDEYKNCKYILIGFNSVEDPTGYLYCVSTSDESYHDICSIKNDFARRRIPCMLRGSYNNGGGLGVQYEIKE